MEGSIFTAFSTSLFHSSIATNGVVYGLSLVEEVGREPKGKDAKVPVNEGMADAPRLALSLQTSLSGRLRSPPRHRPT